MIIHSFTIHGNQKDPTGNAVPKAKLTRGQQWTPRAQSYTQWKTYVVGEFLSSLKDTGMKRLYASNAARYGKPIVLKKTQEARMVLSIYWKDEKHADPESVFGSIADALFENDKHLDGIFNAFHFPKGEGKGSVDVTVAING